MNLCKTSRVLPCSVPNSAPLPSITIKPNLLSSASNAVSASVWNCKVAQLVEVVLDRINITNTFANARLPPDPPYYHKDIKKY